MTTPRAAADTRPTMPGGLAGVRSWPSEAARAWTRAAAARARRDPAVLALVASGSAVRGAGRSDDLDLVLVYEAQRPVLPRPPIDVDLRAYERADAARRLAAGHDYLSWTVRFGRVLVQRGAWWDALRADWLGRLALPSAADADARARAAGRLSRELLAAGDRDAAAEQRISMLTHRARARLSEAGVFPRSRSELAGQLRGVGEAALADRLARALAERAAAR